MICPYLKKIIHVPAHLTGVESRGYIVKFSECVKEECPFYYVTEEHKPSYNKIKEHCQRAESEVVKHGKI